MSIFDEKNNDQHAADQKIEQHNINTNSSRFFKSPSRSPQHEKVSCNKLITLNEVNELLSDIDHKIAKIESTANISKDELNNSTTLTT